MYLKFKLLLICFVALSTIISAQDSPTGTWKTIDDVTGEEKSYIEIYEEDGKYFGKITKLLQSDPGTLCDACKGEKKDKPVLGMVILDSLKPVKDFWKNGNILDPENGKEYGCSIWFEDDKPDELKVRGKHWTGLYRTQSWYRVK